VDGKNSENSFQELEKRLTTSLATPLPNPIRLFVIFCDPFKMRLWCVFMKEIEG